MYIFMIIVGIILAIIGLPIFIASNKATSNQANWDDFMEFARKDNSAVSNYPEEVLYKVMLKIRNATAIMSLLGVLSTVAGIILIITTK